MPFVDPTHHHWASQVIEDGTTAPIEPGGGSLTISAGTDEPYSASSIRVPSGSIAAENAGEIILTAILKDPGVARADETEYAVGDRVSAQLGETSPLAVFECTVAGTSGVAPDPGTGFFNMPGLSTDGDVTWAWVGFISATASASPNAYVSGDGNADALPTANVIGNGNATASSFATVLGDGEAVAILNAQIDGAVSGFAQTGLVSFAGINVISLTATATATGVSLVAFGLPASDPVVAGALWVDTVTGNLKVSAGA